MDKSKDGKDGKDGGERSRFESAEWRNEDHGPDKNEIYKFLGVEPADGNKIKEVYNKATEEISRRMNIITKSELNGNNLVKAIIMLAYPMNICKFTQCWRWVLYMVVSRKFENKNQKKWVTNSIEDETILTINNWKNNSN